MAEPWSEDEEAEYQYALEHYYCRLCGRGQLEGDPPVRYYPWRYRQPCMYPAWAHRSCLRMVGLKNFLHERRHV